jgi:YbbR domain-containing protein
VVFEPPVERVRVRLKFEQRVGARDFAEVPVMLDGTSTYLVSIKPLVATVRLEGPLKALQDLQASDIEALVSVDGLDDKPPGAHRRKLTVSNLPRGVELVRTRPKAIQVTTKPRPAPAAPPEPPGTPAKPDDKQQGREG